VKTIDEYMAMNYPMEVIKDEDEGGYVISFPDLNGCVTCAETIEAALAAAEDAKRAWIEAALEEGYPVSEDTSVLEEIKVDDKLTLLREDNKFDKNAILLITESKKKLGYVPEKDNIIFARLMDAGKLLIAKVKDMNIWDGFRQIKIGIYLVDF
jgi:predicted RNase H-like HicB family nuclease